jgi:hypothetical protein
MTDVRHRACAAFQGGRRIAAGPLAQVALAVKRLPQSAEPVLVLDDATGRPVDLDLRGSDEAVLARLAALAAAFPDPGEAEAEPPPAGPRGRGRPKLGVIAREVTLLPRHWAWLAGQPGGASVALRKLVERARRENAEADAARSRRDGAYRAMSALAGDRPGFETASRALFAADAEAFRTAAAAWPADLAAYLTELAFPLS